MTNEAKRSDESDSTVGLGIRHILGMPPNNESGIDKTDPRRVECVDCIHREKTGKELPCVNCWNPIGDEFVAKNKPKTRVFITCSCCGGSGEIEAPNAQSNPHSVAESG